MIADKILEGSRVRLRPMTERDVMLLARWYGDAEVRHWTHLSEDATRSSSMQRQRERYQHIAEDPAHVHWCIETKEHLPIGDIGLVDIHSHGRAELAICIGEKSYWGQGYGTDAIEAVLRYAFEQLGCRRVYLITDEDNLRAHRAFEHCGFVREGLLRAHRLRYGRPVNMLIMGVLREEFAALGTGSPHLQPIA